MGTPLWICRMHAIFARTADLKPSWNTPVYAKQAMALLHDAVPAMPGWLQRFQRPAPNGNAAVEVPRAHDFFRAHSRSYTAVCAKQATALLHDAVPVVLDWLQRFRRPAPDGNAALEVPGNARGCGPGRAAVAVAGVADIEESVWAPRYGLKGMIDASVHLLMQPVPEGPWQVSVSLVRPILKGCRRRTGPKVLWPAQTPNQQRI